MIFCRDLQVLDYQVDRFLALAKTVSLMHLTKTHLAKQNHFINYQQLKALKILLDK